MGDYYRGDKGGILGVKTTAHMIPQYLPLWELAKSLGFR